MKKKLGVILSLACIGATCLVAGCSKQTELEKYQAKGYTVMVTYDANGGSFLGRQGVTVMDLFRPTDYQADGDGAVHIKLMEPTDASRPTSGTGTVTLTKQGHFFAGWYQTREFRKNDDGELLAEDGKVVEEVEGKYVYEGTETEATPAYTYDDYWDFANDTIDYQQSDGLFEMTLYAAWVPYYQFDYYYRVEGTSAWTYVSSSTFDYKTTNAENSPTHDKDTIWTPEWTEDGAMGYTHSYQNNSYFEFPKIADTTFKSAYLDAECTQKIENGSFEHQGTLDLEKGVAVNRVQNIYIEVEKGERFKISTAEKFVEYAKPNGIYEIQSDLDFTNVNWPNSLALAEFTGSIYSTNGQTYKFKNVSAKVSSASATKAGLFGAIGEGATVKDVIFENTTVDFVSLSTSEDDATFGFFAGNIHEDATVAGIQISGKLRLGQVTLSSATDYQLHLLANGATDGITTATVALEIYGRKRVTDYQYAFVPATDIVNEETWLITLDYSKPQRDNRREQEVIEIDTFEKTTNGGLI